MPDNGHIDASSTMEEPVVSIQIEEVPSDSPVPESGRRWISAQATSDGIQSTNNPHQSPHIYYLAFLVPPLLSAMLDSLGGSGQNDAEVALSFISLLKLISNSKLDTYNDLLEIVAYRGSKARRLAIAALASLWPKSIGHTVITSPLHLLDNEAISSQMAPKTHGHQFVPWYFSPNHGRVHPGDALHDDCRSCAKPIFGFALLCPLCMTAAHFDCYDYPAGNYDLQYSMTHDARMQRIAIFRFANLQANSDHDDLSKIISRNQHDYTAANWFTLCLCFVCRQPLWGIFSQGIKCRECNISLHTKCGQALDPSKRCGSIKITSQDMTVDWDALRKSCIDYYPILNISDEQFKTFGYEEISIFHDVLKTQLQILTNGVEYGSIVILQDRSTVVNVVDQKLKEFELHQTIRKCEDLLDSDRLSYSPSTSQYIRDTETANRKLDVMFSWSYLEYVTAAIKVPHSRGNKTIRTASDLLNVSPMEVGGGDNDEPAGCPLEATSLAHIRQTLAVDFGLRSDFAAQYVVNHLHHLSFLDRFDHNPLPFEDIFSQKEEICTFPLPLGLDLSINVEMLVSAVESSLADLNLSTNEFGFLLLTKRFWPNGLASEYALKRLSDKVLSWILDEVGQICLINTIV